MSRAQLASWREQHLYAALSSLGRLARRPGASLLTTLMMALVLLLPLWLALVVGNLGRLERTLEWPHGLSVFLLPDAKPAAAPTHLGLYLTFFPHLVAGPIVRFSALAGQFAERTVTTATFAEGVRRFIIGLAKKALLGDPLAVTADAVFAQPPGQLERDAGARGLDERPTLALARGGALHGQVGRSAVGVVQLGRPVAARGLVRR